MFTTTDLITFEYLEFDQFRECFVGCNNTFNNFFIENKKLYNKLCSNSDLYNDVFVNPPSGIRRYDVNSNFIYHFFKNYYVRLFKVIVFDFKENKVYVYYTHLDNLV